MPLLRIDGFGQAGLNYDTPPTLLQPGEWTTLQNIDIDSRTVRSAFGEEKLTPVPPIEPKYCCVYRHLVDSEPMVVISDGTSLYRRIRTGAVWVDITDATYPMVGEITFTVFLGSLVICPSASHPLAYQGGANAFPLPGWSSTHTAKTIVAYTNHLVALGYDDGGILGGPKFRVNWSDAAAEGQFPSTWIPAPENLAGSVQLRDTPGILITAEQLRDDLIVYKDDSMYRMYPSNTETVFNFERVASDHGCSSTRGVANLGNVHYFNDAGDLRVFDGQRTESVAFPKVRNLIGLIITEDTANRAILRAHPDKQKVYFGLPTGGTDYIDLILVYDLDHKAWSVRGQAGCLDIFVGPWVLDDPPLNPAPVGDVVLFGISANAPGIAEHTVSRLDNSNTDYNGNALNCLAERIGFRFADLERNVTIRKVYPEIDTTTDPVVSIEVGVTDQVGGPVTWSDPFTFTPKTDRHINVRMTGQPCAFRISSATPHDWRLGALSFEVTPAGMR